VRAEFLPDKHPEFGQCVHKIVQHPTKPERLFLQNHWGLYRSDDGADSWQDIARGVPSDFGFPMVMHPHDPDTVYIVPLESDQYRCTPEGKLRVYRTRDAGRSWQALTRGLPQKNALETVLRDALATDTSDPAGIYVGTRSGQIYNSRDEGNSWSLLMGGLPPVVCVKAVVVGESKKPARVKRTTPRQAPKTRRGAAGSGRRSKPMTVLFHLSSPLRPMAGGDSRVAVSIPSGTVADALTALWELHPGLRDRLLTEQGEMRPHVNLFLGSESIRYTGGLETSLPGDCEISILPAVSGGMN
jgi:molybdopterin converting factor small subunit